MNVPTADARPPAALRENPRLVLSESRRRSRRSFALLFNAQFHFNLDWLFAAGARDRLEAVRDLIIGELEVDAARTNGSR